MTDPAIVKMFVLADRKKPLPKVIEKLHVLPLSLSYEFDPCDVLKAKELSTIALEGRYKKPPGEDLVSLVRGLGGQKGQVVLRLGTPLDGEFETPKDVALEIDRQILTNLELFPVNYWALSRLDEPEYRSLHKEVGITIGQRDALALANRLKKCPPGFRPYWLKIYANPVVNRHRVLNQLP